MKRNLISHWVAVWVTFCAGYSKSVCLFFVLVCGLLANYTAENLGINTKTTDMLSEKLSWRQTLLEHEKYFPQLSNTLIAVVDAQTPTMAIEARDQLVAALSQREDLFDEVYAPNGGELFRQHGLLYLEISELEQLIEQLAKIQPFLGRLERGESLGGYFNLLEQSLQNSELDQSSRTSVASLFTRMTDAVEALQKKEFHRMRWSDNDGGSDDGNTRQLIILKPKLFFDQLLPAKQSIEAVQELTHQLNINDTRGIKVRMTGDIALQSDELQLLASSMPLSSLIAFILVGLVLFFAMRHPVLILSSVATLLAGLVITGAFAAFSVGQLNLISVAFAILFIGLGVDFAIHFCLRYKELLIQKVEHIAALREAGSDVGASLILCSITTSAGFFAFVPTSFKGVSELGLISGVGLIISLITTLTLLPALLSLKKIKTPVLFENAKTKNAQEKRQFIGTNSKSRINDPQFSRRVIVVFSVVIGFACLSLPFASFDNNPINLRSPESESVSAYLDLLNDATTSPLSLSLVNKKAEELEILKTRLQALPTVERVIGLSDFVPNKQFEKLDLFIDLEFILGGTTSASTQLNTETPQQQLNALSSLIHRLDNKLQVEDNATLQRAMRALISLKSDLKTSSASQQVNQLKQLSESLLGDLFLQIKTIRNGLQSKGLQANQLPIDLVKRWKVDSGYDKLQILPSGDMSDSAQTAEFVRSVTALAPNAVGAPIVNIESGLAIVQSFQQAFISAFLIIFALLLLMLRKLRDALLVLAPLMLTVPLIVAVVVLLNTPFNFANIITLPLLLGISVDNGVHMVHRARHALPEASHLLASSTGRAVAFSAATTIASFGNLAFSAHTGTASMGLLLTIGMICNLLCTLLLLPVLINKFMLK